MIGNYIIIDLKVNNNIYIDYIYYYMDNQMKKEKQKLANKRYRAKNKEAYNEYMKKYQKDRYVNNPAAKERLRTQQRKYVARKRAEKLEAKNEVEEIIVLQPNTLGKL
tara:strand:- start:278 stop:601 length:324 start_codon:yes stop_codon:yes gene_type:complete